MPPVTESLSDYGLVTAEEAATMLAVSIRRLQQHTETGRIPVVIVGVGRNRKHLYARAKVAAFVPRPPGAPPGNDFAKKDRGENARKTSVSRKSRKKSAKP